MAKKKYEEANIQAIADTIREKTGTEKTYKTKDMAEGVGEVFEAGKRAEYDAFWDEFQEYGQRTDYQQAFQRKGWTEKNFKPKYPIRPTLASSILLYSAIQDLKQHCIDNNIIIDLSLVRNVDYSFCGIKSISVPDSIGEIQNATNAEKMFADCNNLTSLPRLRSGNNTNFDRICYACYKLKTIAEIDFSKATNLNNSFHGCRELIDVTVKGEIPISINFSSSPLSVASLKSIVKHLKNYVNTSSEFAYTLTVKASAWQALESEGFTDEDYSHIHSVFPDINPTIVDSWDTFVTTWLRWNLVLA